MIAEKNLIAKLKAEAGVAYVNKMTSMIQDLDASKTEMDVYKQEKHKGQPFGIGLNVQVLQNGAWDIDRSKFEKIEIPGFLNKCLDDFKNFYVARHKAQTLSWAFGLVIFIFNNIF
jgi:hypothetical protein